VRLTILSWFNVKLTFYLGAVIPSASNAFLEPSTFIDPLANGAACTRDLQYLTQLGVNTIRVYSVNSSLNHDSCMHTFSNAGIYTMSLFSIFSFVTRLLTKRSLTTVSTLLCL